MAALMVIVACHPQDATCLEEPVAVISYQNDEACYASLNKELTRARSMAQLVYGDCVPVSADLVAGKSIRQDIDPAKLMALKATPASAGSVEAQAMLPAVPNRVPIPLERFQDIR
ncbi:hypothetical protein DMY87_23385 [Rhizobium wuzhouense]|uniref:Uncharacterized protein n=2 Tax=Rhizobium/Agrobacterium group TaxID=227290 RepID=A0ABX5NMA2_9HYPH|nr:hypothetical protein DMY87_23385 [Rhizobium wuzhouense]